jgi:hypothetical protein
MRALARVRYRNQLQLDAVVKSLTLHYRIPDESRLTWARETAGRIKEVPRNRAEVYAHEALLLHARKNTTLELQALRIGDLTIAALPNEVFALTGLKLKAQSPGAAHFNIALANGAEGYIPPPEQHLLGGYTTWPARTAGLEVGAEPKIVETLLVALEDVTGKSRRPIRDEPAPYSQAVLRAGPVAYWRCNDMAGSTAVNAVPGSPAAQLQPGFAWYLPGAGSGSGIGLEAELRSSAFAPPGRINRAVHLAGGDLSARLDDLTAPYSLALWFWLGEPSGASARRGVLAEGPDGLILECRQTAEHQVFLALGETSAPKPVPADTWHLAVLVRDGADVRVHLDGEKSPVISRRSAPTHATSPIRFGRGLQGKLDEIAVFARALSPEEIATLWSASR